MTTERLRSALLAIATSLAAVASSVVLAPSDASAGIRPGASGTRATDRLGRPTRTRKPPQITWPHNLSRRASRRIQKVAGQIAEARPWQGLPQHQQPRGNVKEVEVVVVKRLWRPRTYVILISSETPPGGTAISGHRLESLYHYRPSKEPHGPATMMPVSGRQNLERSRGVLHDYLIGEGGSSPVSQKLAE